MDHAILEALKASLDGTAIALDLPNWGCPGCRLAIAVGRVRHSLAVELRAAGHTPAFGPTERYGRPYLEVRCQHCPWLFTAVMDDRTQQPALRAERYFFLDGCWRPKGEDLAR
jgi:hypothetical protein